MKMGGTAELWGRCEEGSAKMQLTSLNLSHLPVSHLSSKKLPLSERPETRPKATAHTHSKATLSICGCTTTPRSGWRTARKTPAFGNPVGGARGRKTANKKNSEAEAFVSYLVSEAILQSDCEPATLLRHQ